MKTTRHHSGFSLFLLLACIPFLSCKEDTTIHSQKKMEWFHQAKFGMFIHWGLYAVPAGEWEGKKDHGEWIQFSANIPGPEYEKLADHFNPVKFNAEELVSLAKQAGMKYLVITSKHHDGFCMFDSELTDYDIVDASPYGKDPMKELAEECKRQGIKFCLYYSIMDWHHPDYPVEYTHFSKTHPEGFHGFPNPDADYGKYWDFLVGQVRELFTNYGDLGILWWDGAGMAFADHETGNMERARVLTDSINKWQPMCLINNRLSGFGADYGTPEQMIPGGKQRTAFEVCMTLNDHWGYNKNDNNWKSTRDVIYNLCDIASKGGNYLLNVGPTAEGLLPEEYYEILKEVGQWLSVNGEAIYGTTSGGGPMRWNRDIDMITAKPGTFYLHLFNWPEDNKIYLDHFTKEVKKAYLLADEEKKSLNMDTHTHGKMIHLPEKPLDPINNVVVINF